MHYHKKLYGKCTSPGWVAGGCNGTNYQNGQNDSNSYIYLGGDATIGDPSTSVNGTDGGNVFGAGRGNNGQHAYVFNSHIVIADHTDILRDVYGGGNMGKVGGDTKVIVNGQN